MIYEETRDNNLTGITQIQVDGKTIFIYNRFYTKPIYSDDLLEILELAYKYSELEFNGYKRWVQRKKHLAIQLTNINKEIERIKKEKESLKENNE